MGPVSIGVEVQRNTDGDTPYIPVGVERFLFLYEKRLRSSLNILSLVAVKKKEKVGKIVKIEIKRIDTNRKKKVSSLHVQILIG